MSRRSGRWWAVFDLRAARREPSPVEARTPEPSGPTPTDGDQGRPEAEAPAPDRAARWQRWGTWALLAATILLLAVGGGLWLAGAREAADWCWGAATVLALVPSVVWLIAALRRGRTGVDAIAVLALVGSLAVGEFLAGALIALMLTTGRTLENYAEGRATRDLHSLIARAPRTARRRTPTDEVEVVPLSSVRSGDRLLVGPGEVVPVDGRCEEPAVLDESVLTGESMLVERESGAPVASGAVNAGPAFGLTATATELESTYAGIVRLAQQATAESAPVTRVADRYATYFLPLTLLLAGVAWLWSADPVRAVAVLVVATPCPLLLAVPIAIVSGMSLAARRGVVIRGGGVLETLGRGVTLLIDKTGTLTAGEPSVVGVVTAPDGDRDAVLADAAAVEQLSPHVLADAIVAEAIARRLTLPVPTDVTERPGVGVAGTVAGRTVEVGRVAAGPIPDWATAAQRRAEWDGTAVSWVNIDGAVAGMILLRDPVRPDAVRTIHRLRDAGLRRVVMVTGDRRHVAERVARAVGLDEVIAECTPADKVTQARRESERAPTVMVGDGVNDAPALAAADVGVALGARGATAAAEAADAVMTVDRLDRLGDTVVIARRSRRIAGQSAWVGMALSLGAMLVAAVGLLPPAPGALLQEGIDVLAIASGLRALSGRRIGGPTLTADTQAMLSHFADEHAELWDVLGDLRATADQVAAAPRSPAALPALRRVHERLVEEILPHEHAEEHRLYPALAEPFGGREVTSAMSRMHREIDELVERIGLHLRQASGPLLPVDQVPDLLASLYGLDTILRLHFQQEEEQFFSLVPAGDG